MPKTKRPRENYPGPDGNDPVRAFDGETEQLLTIPCRELIAGMFPVQTKTSIVWLPGEAPERHTRAWQIVAEVFNVFMKGESKKLKKRARLHRRAECLALLGAITRTLQDPPKAKFMIQLQLLHRDEADLIIKTYTAIADHAGLLDTAPQE